MTVADAKEPMHRENIVDPTRSAAVQQSTDGTMAATTDRQKRSPPTQARRQGQSVELETGDTLRHCRRAGRQGARVLKINTNIVHDVPCRNARVAHRSCSKGMKSETEMEQPGTRHRCFPRERAIPLPPGGGSTCRRRGWGRSYGRGVETLADAPLPHAMGLPCRKEFQAALSPTRQPGKSPQEPMHREERPRVAGCTAGAGPPPAVRPCITLPPGRPGKIAARAHAPRETRSRGRRHRRSRSAISGPAVQQPAARPTGQIAGRAHALREHASRSMGRAVTPAGSCRGSSGSSDRAPA